MSELLSNEIGALGELDLHQLREAWAARYGAPPTFRSTTLFRLMLAWRMQAAVHGGFDAETCRTLARRGQVEAEGRHFGLGAKLRRTWNGQEIIVEVTERGFAWGEKEFKSLSAVATAIAGSKWNGPRFFGLRP